MKDKCIMCGKETQYDVTTHIDFRNNYVEGAGQLCDSCASGDNVFEMEEYVKVPIKIIKEKSNYYDLGSYVFQEYNKLIK